MSKPERGAELSVEKSTIDRVDAAILRSLDAEARLSMRQLAPVVGLSAPSVAERVRKIEEAGVIRSYRITVDSKALGYASTALPASGPFLASCTGSRR